MDPLTDFDSRRFLNLAHHWLAETTDPEKLDQLDQILTGPPTTTESAIDPQAGVRPPAWWDGDDEATATSMAALTSTG